MLQTNILFLDETNNARSLLAEAYYNQGHNNAARAFSAGFVPDQKLDRHVYDVLKESGISPEDFHPKPVAIFLQAYSPRIDLIVGFKPVAGKFILPIFPHSPPIVHLSVDDIIPDAAQFARRRAVKQCYADVRMAIDRATAVGKLPGSVAA